jgi:hypothetical protein
MKQTMKTNYQQNVIAAALVGAVAAVVVTTTTPAFAEGAFVDPFTLAIREAANAPTRTGDVSAAATTRTDERYNTGTLFSGPRGWGYWNYLLDPQGYQNPNLWPDKRPTYLFGEMNIPAGAELTVHGWFPHVRFFNFSIYLFERNTFVGASGGSIDGYEIEPEPGSTNPYRVGADRNAKDRNFTVRIIAKAAPANPADRAKNTVYLGDGNQTIFGGFRMYVSDKGYDGTGWGPGDRPSHNKPGLTYEATLADGTKLSEAEATKRFGKLMGDAPPPVTIEEWYKLVNNPANNPAMTPATAPATKDGQFFLFTGMKDILLGAFMPPAERAKIPKPKAVGSGANASTAYLVNFTSRQYGPLYVFRGKMPTFPDTWANVGTMPDGEVQYWSVATMATFVNGSLWDGVFDMQVPLDKDGFYTIVVCLPEDRPKNATTENGVAWINWGAGEGIGDPRNRKDWGALLMRFMVPKPDWPHSPLKAKSPEELATVMGPYYPRGYYTTKEEFEKEGARKLPAAQ